MNYRVILLLGEVSMKPSSMKKEKLKDKFIQSLVKHNLKSALQDKTPIIQFKLVQNTIFSVINKKIHHIGIKAACSNLKMERDGINMVRVSLDLDNLDYKAILKSLDLETMIKDEKAKEVIRMLKSMDDLQERMIDGLFEHVKEQEFNQILLKVIDVYQLDLIKAVNHAIPQNLPITVQGVSVEKIEDR